MLIFCRSCNECGGSGPLPLAKCQNEELSSARMAKDSRLELFGRCSGQPLAGSLQGSTFSSMVE
jgi:hypothetical protein